MFQAVFGQFDARLAQNSRPAALLIAAGSGVIPSFRRFAISLLSARWGQRMLQGGTSACLCYVPIVFTCLCYVQPSLLIGASFVTTLPDGKITSVTLVSIPY